MDNKTALWKQVTEDSKIFGCHERLTPHIYALFKATNKYLSDLKADTLLDVGAGDKRYRGCVNCIRYISLDVSGRMDVIADATALPFKNNSLDMILCTQVLEHIKNPFLAVEEFGRILSENGTILITVPTVMYLHEVPQDYFRYTRYGIEHILNKNNISVKKSETISSGFIVGLELFFIGVYSVIYMVFKHRFTRRMFVNVISYFSHIFVKLDNSYVKSVFPGNISVIAVKKGG